MAATGVTNGICCAASATSPTAPARTRSSCARATTGCASSTGSISSPASGARKYGCSGRLEAMPTREEIIEALRAVEDPELGMDIVELGLLYDVEVEAPKVHVTFSLTSMGCPVGPLIEQQIRETVESMDGVQERGHGAHLGPALDAGEDVRRRRSSSWLGLPDGGNRLQRAFDSSDERTCRGLTPDTSEGAGVVASRGCGGRPCRAGGPPPASGAPPPLRPGETCGRRSAWPARSPRARTRRRSPPAFPWSSRGW